MWEERYSVDDYVYGTEPNSFLRENVSALPTGDVLCLAEGEGRNAVFLATTGRRVSSVDLTEAGVAKIADVKTTKTAVCVSVASRRFAFPAMTHSAASALARNGTAATTASAASC